MDELQQQKLSLICACQPRVKSESARQLKTGNKQDCVNVFLIKWSVSVYFKGSVLPPGITYCLLILGFLSGSSALGLRGHKRQRPKDPPTYSKKQNKAGTKQRTKSQLAVFSIILMIL